MLQPAAVVLDFAIPRRWGLDRRAENLFKCLSLAMLLHFAVMLSGVARPNLTLQSGE